VSARRRDAAVAVAVAAVALGVYLATLQPDFGGPEDTPKFQFIGYVLGTPHPPGYPLYVLLSHAFVALPIGTIAYRANLFSAVMAALACALAYAIARQLEAGRWPAICAALGLATGASFWRSAVFAEVYSLAAVMAALTIALLLAWGARGGTARLLAAFGAFAMGLGNHLTIAGLVPAFAIYVLTRGRRIWSVRLIAGGALLLAIGLGQYALILVRTHQGAPYLEIRAEKPADLFSVVTAERFADQRFAFGPAVLFTEHLPVTARLIVSELGAAGAVLCLVGAAAGMRRANPAAPAIAQVAGRSSSERQGASHATTGGGNAAAPSPFDDAQGVVSVEEPRSGARESVLGSPRDEAPRIRLLLGAAAGLVAMILNLSGDLKGFITPLMPLLWPLAAVGIDRVARAAGSIRRGGPVAASIVLGAAVLLPMRNVMANYASADQSGQSEQARFLRGVFSQLPEGSGFVTEDYWADMAWTYYTVTGEAGPDRRIARVGFDAASVRRAAHDGRRVFALAGAATFLAGEGLQFRRAAIEGPPLARWLAALPRGSVLVGATARASVPVNLAVIGHAELHPNAPTRAFEVFAAVSGRPGGAWRAADEAVSLDVDATSLSAALPAFAGALTATAGAAGAGIDFAGRTIARAERGVVLAVFAPDGTLVRALEWPPGEASDVPYSGVVYELAGAASCATVTADRWTDITPVLAGGSWVATFASTGSIAMEMIASGPPGPPGLSGARVRSAVLMGDGTIQTAVTSTPEGDVFSTTLTRAGESRPVFRVALDRVPSSGRARLRAGGARPTIDLCGLSPVHPLVAPGRTSGVLRPDFESEAYFGAGWTDAQRTPTGPVRRGEDGATLFLPLDRGVTYRLLLDLAVTDTSERAAASEPRERSAPAERRARERVGESEGRRPSVDDDLEVTLNGVPVGTCRPHACDLLLTPSAIVAGTNTVRLSLPRGAHTGPVRLILREARIQIAP
jgi:Protein of unknown function (DUF2723)